MNRNLAFTTRLTREDAAGIMEALMEGMREGLVKVQKSDASLEMDVPRVIDLEVRAGLGEERASFFLEASWRLNREENPDVPDQDGAASQARPAGRASGRARASMLEAARAARAAARDAGVALEKTARAATVLVREGADRLTAENSRGEVLLRQVKATVAAAARRARGVVRGIAGRPGESAVPPAEHPAQDIAEEHALQDAAPNTSAASAPNRRRAPAKAAKATPASRKSPAREVSPSSPAEGGEGSGEAGGP
ncbi:MAG: amphi-Trp domain-containing protein, partial [Desulfovibrio sp.]|nr:amphi-Trp domain-containing protein [Desulfovibrio sp.]